MDCVAEVARFVCHSSSTRTHDECIKTLMKSRKMLCCAICSIAPFDFDQNCLVTLHRRLQRCMCIAMHSRVRWKFHSSKRHRQSMKELANDEKEKNGNQTAIHFLRIH
jgi:hypothetical protein